MRKKNLPAKKHPVQIICILQTFLKMAATRQDNFFYLSAIQLMLCAHTMDFKPDYATTKEKKPTFNDELDRYLPDDTRC